VGPDPQAEGDVKVKTIRMDEELRAVMLTQLVTQLERFRRKFGRDPGPSDPVFFDSEADTPRPINLAEANAKILKAMKLAGIPARLIHAYKRTGRIVSEDNKKYLTPEELAEWAGALAEYDKLH
jgi:hypothetical protein